MAYIGKSPSGTGVRSRFFYTQSSAGATSISGNDDDNRTLTFSDAEYVDVYLNGSLLAKGDYTAASNTISGLAALASGDIVEVVVYDIFSVADTVSAKDGGTFSGNVGMQGLTATTGAFSGNVGMQGLTATTSSFSGDLTVDRGTTHASAVVKGGDATTNFSGGSLLLANPGMATNYGGTYLYHHKAGGSGNTNAAFNISQRTAAGAYVSNIWNVDYQTNTQSFYLPNGAQSGTVVLGIDGAGRVTTPSQPAFEVTNTTSVAAGNTVVWQTVSTNRGNNWNSGTNSFVAPVAGFYCFTLTVFSDRTGATGDFFWDVHVNNSFRHRLYQAKNGSTNSHLQLNAAFAFFMSANDAVKIRYTAGPANTGANTSHNKFAGFLVG